MSAIEYGADADIIDFELRQQRLAHGRYLASQLKLGIGFKLADDDLQCVAEAAMDSGNLNNVLDLEKTIEVQKQEISILKVKLEVAHSERLSYLGDADNARRALNEEIDSHRETVRALEESDSQYKILKERFVEATSKVTVLRKAIKVLFEGE